jgi:GABA(A) receptor-associated protein
VQFISNVIIQVFLGTNFFNFGLSLEILFRMVKNYLIMSFKQTHTLSQRYEESQRVLEKYPNRVPVICEVDPKQSTVIHLRKMKYLVPDSLTVGQFVYVLRKQMTLKPEEAVFIMINNVLPPTAALMSQIYYEHKEADGFLYAYLCKENTFG